MDRYCTLYVNDKLDLKRLIDSINGLIGSNIKAFDSIRSDDFAIVFTLNGGYNAILEKVFPDGFLFFKYRLEISFEDNVNISFCVEMVGKILVHLWKEGVTAIASADYEETLPEKGGYKSYLIPWVDDFRGIVAN